MSRFYRSVWGCLLLFMMGCSAEVNDPLEAIPDPKTLGESYVSDPDSVLRPATVQLLNAQLRALDQSGRVHIDVAVAKSIGDAVPKTMATALFDRWKIGEKAKDNGLLLLLVLDQRRVEFETGYGLEADLPDIICFRIQQRVMLPLLKANRYDEAVTSGVSALRARLAGSDSAAKLDSLLNAAASIQATEGSAVAPAKAALTAHDRWIGMGSFFAMSSFMLFLLAIGLSPTDHRSFKFLLLGLLPVCLVGTGNLLNPSIADNTSLYSIIALSYLLPLGYLHWTVLQLNQHYDALPATTSRQEQYAYLDQRHSSLETFFRALFFPVGMLFYWLWNKRRMHQLRAAPYACPICSGAMHRLGEKQDDAFLEPGKVAEEKAKSIDYDVFQCLQCSHTLTIDFKNLGSEVKRCPQCKYQTLKAQAPTVELAPTTSSTGWGWEYSCCGHCQHETPKKKYIIDSKSTSSSSSSSSSGSSSSSSSSGGSSGGGGSGSSW
ncbi:hypothetical protein GCM10022409_19890 [Hymenobacter glaciei]|uniref:TPM domain-containing protein n=1 Tax=Hymenobacter glaciei TaxID=877209 RepID=A0ABP7U3T4_9BACT